MASGKILFIPACRLRFAVCTLDVAVDVAGNKASSDTSATTQGCFDPDATPPHAHSDDMADNSKICLSHRRTGQLNANAGQTGVIVTQTH